MDKAEFVFEKYATKKEDAQDTAVGLVTGAMAGGISTAAVQPLSQISNIKSTFGANPAYEGRSKTYKDVIKAIYHGDVAEIPKEIAQYDRGVKGIKNFYHGLGGKLIQTAPQSALLLGANALLYKAYKKSKRESEKKNG